MKYEFKEIKDKATWNNFLTNYPTLENKIEQFSFIQSYQWMEFQESTGKETYKLGIFENGELVGVAAAVIIRAKRGSHLYIRNGPVLDWSNTELVKEFINHIKTFAKRKKLWFVRISPLVEKNSKGANNIEKLKLPICQMNDVEALDTWVMNIEDDELTLFNKIKKKTRYEVRKAEKICEVIVSSDIAMIEDFYEIELDTVERNKWNVHSKEYIKKEFEKFNQNQNSNVVLIKYDNKFIAGGVFITFAKQTYYHYGASLTEYRNIPASYLMIWEAIKLAKSKESSYFNFWGITPENAKENHPWTGLTRFKMKFPGFEQRWIPARDIPVSSKYLLTNIFERYDKSRKGY